MRLLDRLRARRALCKNCRSRPRDPALTVSAESAAFSTVTPGDYCSRECMDDAHSRLVW